MLMAFYDTAKFKKLQAKWYQKLEEDGFEDAEVQAGNQIYLRELHSTYFQKKYDPKTFRSKQIYYQKASEYYYEMPWYATAYEYTVWRYHADGKSLRDIAKIMETKICRIHKIIRRLSKQMLQEDFE
jgi:hypothetical protein